MKPIICLFLLFSIASTCISQELPYTDFRTKKESFSKLSDKQLRADLATFTKGGIDESVGKQPLRKIGPSQYVVNSMSFKEGDVEAVVTSGPFDPKGKKVMKQEEFVVKINNKPMFGAYGEMPRTTITDIRFTIGKDTLQVPATAYTDLFNLNLTYKDRSGVQRTANGVFFSADKSHVYLYLLSRDEKGGYEVTWIFQDKQFIRRVVDYELGF
jgi:hypothetical protein